MPGYLRSTKKKTELKLQYATEDALSLLLILNIMWCISWQNVSWK